MMRHVVVALDHDDEGEDSPMRLFSLCTQWLVRRTRSLGLGLAKTASLEIYVG